MPPQEVVAINVNSSYCRSAQFDFSYGKLQAVSTSTNYPLEHCHKYICLSPQGWEAVIDYLIDIYTWKDKHFKTKTDKREEIGSDLKAFINASQEE
jgi:hypothetical protein